MVKKEPKKELTGRRRNFQQLLEELQELLPHTDSRNAIATLENAVSFVRQSQDDPSVWEEPAISAVDRLGLVLDSKGTILFATPSCAAALQFTPGQLTNRNILEFVYWKCAPAFLRWLHKADSAVQPEVFLRTEGEEYLHVRVTRKWAASRVGGQPVQICFLDVLGEPTMPAGGLVALGQDSTVQPYYMLSLHSLPTLDCLSFWCSANTVLGLPVEQLRVMKPFENMHPDDALFAGLAARQGFERMKPFVMQMRMINVASQRWDGGEVQVTPCVERGTGTVLGAIAIARNIENPIPQISRVVEEQMPLLIDKNDMLAVLEQKLCALRLRSEQEEVKRQQQQREEERRVFAEHGRLLAALRSPASATSTATQPDLLLRGQLTTSD